MDELSPNMIFEILTRVPSLKTLDTCKLVCKEWHELINHPSFMPCYCKRTNNLCGYIIGHTSDKNFVSFNQSDKVCTKRLTPRDTTILASCNQGIIFCFYNPNSRYYLNKPTTRQWQVLPNPNNALETVAAALTVLQSSSDYLRCKIVRLVLQRICPESMKVSYTYETFDSKFWTWRELEAITLPLGEKIISSNPAIPANSYHHWLTYHDNVLAFHHTSSSLHKFELPQPVYKNDLYKCKQLSEYQRKLGFTCLTQECNMELWILENHTRWIKKMTINLKNIERVVKFPYPLGFCNKDTAFMKAYNEVVFYNVRDCSYNTVKMDGTQFFQFRSDLESVNLLGPRIESRRRKTNSSLIWFLVPLVLLCLGVWELYEVIVS